MRIVENIKNGNKYAVLFEDCINSTNNVDGQIMVCYCTSEKVFVREYKEFWKKFKQIK